MKAKDMKEDEVGNALMSFGERASAFLTANRSAVIAVAVGIVVLVVGINGFRWWQSSKALAAQSAYGEVAKRAEDLENPPAAVPGEEAKPATTWAEVATDFQKVATDHAGTMPGELAAYQAGIAQLRAGDAATAVTTLTAFTDTNPKSWAAPHALAALATARESTGDLTGAEAALVKLKDGDFTSYAPGLAIARLAEFYDRHDRGAEAQTLWTLLADDARFADTAAQGQAKSKVSKPS